MGIDAAWDIDKLNADVRAKGWLPQDLARKAGCSAMTVSRVLRGLRGNPRTIARLAEALGHDASRYVREAVAP